MQVMMQDMGMDMGIRLKTDATAAIGIVNGVGVGKVRHIEVNQLWVQEKVSNGEITIVKIGTKDNLADALTKAVASDELQMHMKGLGMCIKEGRSVSGLPILGSSDQRSETPLGRVYGLDLHRQTARRGARHVSRLLSGSRSVLSGP